MWKEVPLKAIKDKALEFEAGDGWVDVLRDARGECAVHFGPKLWEEVGMHIPKNAMNRKYAERAVTKLE